MISEVKKYIDSESSINLSELEVEETVLVVVDMINGFVHTGALASPRIKNIIPAVSDIVLKCIEKNIDIIAFADCHSESSVEFDSFPVHCLEGTDESDIIDEIKNILSSDKMITIIPKNSTNGFHAPEFKRILEKNKTNFIVCGDCTDICVHNFCITLKTYLNEINLRSRVIVPLNAVETYNGNNHDAYFMNLASLAIMKTNGIELVKELE